MYSVMENSIPTDKSDLLSHVYHFVLFAFCARAYISHSKNMYKNHEK